MGQFNQIINSLCVCVILVEGGETKKNKKKANLIWSIHRAKGKKSHTSRSSVSFFGLPCFVLFVHTGGFKCCNETKGQTRSF